MHKSLLKWNSTWKIIKIMYFWRKTRFDVYNQNYYYYHLMSLMFNFIFNFIVSYLRSFLISWCHTFIFNFMVSYLLLFFYFMVSYLLLLLISWCYTYFYPMIKYFKVLLFTESSKLKMFENWICSLFYW